MTKSKSPARRSSWLVLLSSGVGPGRRRVSLPAAVAALPADPAPDDPELRFSCTTAQISLPDIAADFYTHVLQRMNPEKYSGSHLDKPLHAFANALKAQHVLLSNRDADHAAFQETRDARDAPITVQLPPLAARGEVGRRWPNQRPPPPGISSFYQEFIAAARQSDFVHKICRKQSQNNLFIFSI